MVAEHLNDTILAGGTHLGFKATENISIGVYAAYAHFDSAPKLETYRLAGEAAFHGSNVSISGIAGYEHSRRASTVVGPVPGFTVVDIYGREGGFFSMADISFYPSDDWSLTAGHRYVGRRHAAALGTEKAFAGSGVSLFAEGRVGDSGYTAAWAGIRIKLGGDRSSSLRASDQAGYTNRLKDEMFVPTNTRRRTLVPNAVVAPPPAPPPPPSTGSGSCCGGTYCGRAT